ncbi:molybdopterin/thiamine biosynthesis adenylyltransferase [Catenulispora sp. GP43]|uniref:HesA/MoeB/ThiF family protein n=1 Tax=Catenulispora sp. GP43 TaxID=3156263 RepID=UPI003511E4C1
MTSRTEDRFARTRLVEGWDQDRLAAATAVVMGVGALGNEVAKNLALAGVGRLILCDPDTVAVANLSRTVLFTEADVGRPKADVAADALARLSPGTAVTVRRADLVAGVGLGELADADLVLGCLDTLRARMRLLGRCALVDAALVDGGTLPWGGEVRLRLAGDEACYACALSPRERGASDLPWSCAEPFDAGPVPSTIAGTAAVASWMTFAALGVLFATPPRYRILDINALTGRSGPVSVTRAADCPHHLPLTGPVEPIPVSVRDTVGALLEALPAGSDPLAWREFPLQAHCPQTGDYDLCQAGDPGAGGCPGCGTTMRTRSSTRLRDAAAGQHLDALGVAPEEILPVRSAKGEYLWRRLSR